MKVLRAHDYPTPEFQPNVRALRRISAALVATTLFCLAICALLIFRDAKTQHNPDPMLVRCTCMGRCLRR